MIVVYRNELFDVVELARILQRMTYQSRHCCCLITRFYEYELT